MVKLPLNNFCQEFLYGKCFFLEISELKLLTSHVLENISVLEDFVSHYQGVH